MAEQPSISIAYADLADSISAMVVVIIKGRAQAIFDQARVPIEIIANKMSSQTDDQLVKLFKQDRKVRLGLKRTRSTEEGVSSLFQSLKMVSEMFSRVDYDEMFSAAAQLKVLAVGKATLRS